MKPVRNLRKGQLPEKPCVHCGRPMEWRRKWARDWEHVKYCSGRCRNEARRLARQEGA